MAEIRLPQIDVKAQEKVGIPSIDVQLSGKPIKLQGKPTVIEPQLSQDKLNVQLSGRPIKPEVKYTKDPLNFAINMASNFIPSTINVAKGYVEPVLHPIETYNNIKTVFNGFAELKAYNDFIKENPDSPKPPITQNMMAAQGVAEYFAERYGDVVGEDKDAWSVVGQKILRTLENDPAGLMADVGSILTLGTTGVTRLGGKTGQIAKGIRTAGENIDPIMFAAKKTKQIVVDPTIDLLSGKGTSGMVQSAYDISKSSARGAEALRNGLKGKVTPSEIINDFNKKVNDHKVTIQKDFGIYEQGLKNKTADFESLDKIKASLDDMYDDLYYTQQIKDDLGNTVNVTRVKPATNKFKLQEYEDISKMVNDFDNLDTIKADDILRLKQELGNKRFNVPADTSHPLNQQLKDFNKFLEDDLAKVDPRTPEVMKQYNTMKYDLDKIRKTIGQPENRQTQISKLQQLVKDTPRGQVGLKNIDKILQDLETQAIPQITGLELSDPLRARGSILSLLGGAGTTAAITGLERFANLDPFIGLTGGAIGLLASSPRTMGEIASRLGTASRYGVNLENFTNIGRYGRPAQQVGLEPFPVTDTEEMKFRIDPSLFPQ